MPKFLVEATYTAEGLRGLAKDKASGRKAVMEKLVASVGGKLEAVYFSFGSNDVVVIADAPDSLSVAALSVAASASGLVRTKVTHLLTAEEMDQALSKSISYRAPGT